MTVVSATGRLAGSAVRELSRTCCSIGGEFVLDLTGLRSAGPDGVIAIRELICGGATLRGVSPFIRLLLDDRKEGSNV
jgi:hypothetical protein